MEKKQKQHGHRYTIGVDPGQNGGIVVLKNGKPVKKLPTPVIGSEFDYAYIRKFFLHYKKRNAVVYFEELQGRGGGWGASQNFKMARCYEMIKSHVSALGLRNYEIKPKVWQDYVFKGTKIIWKKKAGAKKKSKDTKAMALAVCNKLFPSFDTRKNKRCSVPHDGIVDAILIGYYGDQEQKGIQHG